MNCIVVDNDFNPTAGASSVYDEYENEIASEDDTSTALPFTAATSSSGSVRTTFLHHRFRPGVDPVNLADDAFKVVAARRFAHKAAVTNEENRCMATDADPDRWSTLSQPGRRRPPGRLPDEYQLGHRNRLL